MKKAFILLVSLIFLIGCVQTKIKINIKPDGSGTIEESVLMKKDIIQYMSSMVPKDESTDDPFSLFDEEELKENASAMGNNVKYLKGEKVETDDFSGYKAIYTFDDIRELNINQNPGEKLSGKSSIKSEDEFITFNFDKKATSILKIKMPISKKIKKNAAAKTDKKKKEKDLAKSQLVLNQMKTFFDGMYIVIEIGIEGKIIESNADYIKGKTITLMEIDFGELLADPDKLSQLDGNKMSSLQNAKELLKEIPGMKINLKDEITVKFK